MQVLVDAPRWHLVSSSLLFVFQADGDSRDSTRNSGLDHNNPRYQDPASDVNKSREFSAKHHHNEKAPLSSSLLHSEGRRSAGDMTDLRMSVAVEQETSSSPPIPISHDSARCETPDSSMRVIDFAHAYPLQCACDAGYLYGLTVRNALRPLACSAPVSCSRSA